MINPVDKLTRLVSYGQKRWNLGRSCGIIWSHCQIIPMCREIEIMWYLEDHSARDCERETSTFIKRDEEKDSL